MTKPDQKKQNAKAKRKPKVKPEASVSRGPKTNYIQHQDVRSKMITK